MLLIMLNAIYSSNKPENKKKSEENITLGVIIIESKIPGDIGRKHE